MSLKSARQTHRSKCYCQNRRCCQTPVLRASIWQKQVAPVKSNSRNATSIPSGSSLKPRLNVSGRGRFVKTLKSCNGAAQPRLGFGHSQPGNNGFIRRNSTATRNNATSTSTRTTTTTSVANAFLPNAAAVDMRSSAAKLSCIHQQRSNSAMQTTTTLLPSAGYTYTAQRSYYECAQKELHSFLLARTAEEREQVAVMQQQQHTPIVDAHLLALQQFRLQNLDDCFSAQRQNELKLQTNASAQSEECQGGQRQQQQPLWLSIKPWQKVKPADPHEPKEQPDLDKLTPYVVRQRLLKLSLEAQKNEHGRPRSNGRSEIFGSRDKSFALRFQDAYGNTIKHI